MMSDGKPGGYLMNFLLGSVLIISLMTLIFLGPEWARTLRKNARSFRKVGDSTRRALKRPTNQPDHGRPTWT